MVFICMPACSFALDFDLRARVLYEKYRKTNIVYVHSGTSESDIFMEVRPGSRYRLVTDNIIAILRPLVQ